MTPREIEARARAYCESIGANPDETIRGYFDTGVGHAEWTTAPRWCWYRGAWPDWDRPLSGYERALVQAGRL